MRKALVSAALTALLFSAACCFAVSSYADRRNSGDPETIYKRTVESREKYTYTALGTSYLRHDGKPVVSEVKICRRKPNKSRIEYLSPPLKGLVVGRTDGKTWRIDPKLGEITYTDRRAGGNRNSNVALLFDNHRVESTDGGVIARRPCVELIIREKSGEIRKRLWVDASTYVVLKSENYNPAGRITSSTEIKCIKYVPSLPDSLFELPRGAKRSHSQQYTARSMSIEQVSREVGFKVVVPRYVPDGYKLKGREILYVPGSSRKVAFLRYSNGLDRISIFEATRASDDPKRDVMLDHANRRFGRNEPMTICTASTHDLSFVVIGSLPRQKLSQIADSLKHSR